MNRGENVWSESESATGRVGERAMEAQEMASREMERQVERLSSSIRRAPLQSAAIAAGVGFLFALLARR